MKKKRHSLEKMRILNLGCGKNRIKSGGKRVIGVDKIMADGVDVVWDLEKIPWPFKDNEFDMVIASHILEHLSDTVKAFDEIHRITKNGGKLIVKVPHFSSRWAWGDPSHKRAFSLGTFKHPLLNNKFKLLKLKLRWIPRTNKYYFSILIHPFNKIIEYLANKFPNFCENIWCYWVGGFSEIYVEMEIVK
jgi:SAM-dependent methyltransferase